MRKQKVAKTLARIRTLCGFILFGFANVGELLTQHAPRFGFAESCNDRVGEIIIARLLQKVEAI